MKKKINPLIGFKDLFYLVLLLMCYPLFGQSAEKWVAPKEADQIRNPLISDDKAIEKGKKIYYQVCAVCHGRSGKGDGPTGKTLAKKPADHTSISVQEQSDGALYYKISKGRDLMPSYNEVFSNTQRWQLIAYIRTLKENN